MLLVTALAPTSTAGELTAQPEGLPTIAQRIQGLERNDGFLPYYYKNSCRLP
jgi:hypothetical protein